MASYGVPDDLDGTLPWEWAQERLVRSRNYWVATVDPRGRPHAMPVWGVWRADDDTFSFSCAADSLKARNLAANPHVVVASDDTVEVVSVEGVAEPRPGSRDIGLLYASKYEPDEAKRDEMADFFAANAMFVVRPAKAFGMIETPEEFARAATRWVF